MITIDEWIIIQHKQLKAFEKMFREGQRDNPEFFPMTLPHGEWDEQFRMFEI